ncbi:MAG: helix-turn-helix transcriptional regulator [Planctomycetes bacterium]|nr:helix-turn-helix transcriptional regulator [Planctomycetota bacterium]
MDIPIQSLEIAGKRFVVMPAEQYERMRADRDAALPPLPPADAEGNRPGVDFVLATIARDVARERRAFGLSPQDLAKLAGVRQETVSRLESGKHSPTARTLAKIERALKRAAR